MTDKPGIDPKAAWSLDQFERLGFERNIPQELESFFTPADRYARQAAVIADLLKKSHKR